MGDDIASEPVWGTLAARGLYDPDSPVAGRRRQALQLLLDRGATVDDLDACRDELGAFAARLALGGVSTLTRREIADRSGLSIEELQRLLLASGIPDPGPDALAGTESDLAVFQIFGLGASLFGEDTTYQLARVIGAAAAKIADAVVSAFAADIAPTVADDPSELTLIEANLQLADLLPPFMTAFEQLFRRHAIQASRPQMPSAVPGYESQRLLVGFVDLVGSTELARQLSTAELGAALSVFEARSADIVVSHRGRVVKLIGDEIMFTATDVEDGCVIAQHIVAAFADHDVLPPVRAGLAYGDVLTRDGDCFGPTVNLAARIVGQANVSEILVDVGLVDTISSNWTATPLEPRKLKGFNDPVTPTRLTHTTCE